MLVDDEMISRKYMELYILPAKRYAVAALLNLAQDALPWCEENGPPDLIIMDVMMAEGINGLAAAKEIKTRWPQTRVILATSMADPDWIDKARDAALEGFWFKTDTDRSLLDVMDAVMAGETVYPDQAPLVNLGKLPASALTRQQRSVLRLMVEGYTNKEIAGRLGISPNTVKEHIERLLLRSGIRSRTALAAQASRLGVAISDSESESKEK